MKLGKKNVFDSMEMLLLINVSVELLLQWETSKLLNQWWKLDKYFDCKRSLLQHSSEKLRGINGISYCLVALFSKIEHELLCDNYR